MPAKYAALPVVLSKRAEKEVVVLDVKHGVTLAVLALEPLYNTAL
jgi:hypothetical protein